MNYQEAFRKFCEGPPKGLNTYIDKKTRSKSEC